MTFGCVLQEWGKEALAISVGDIVWIRPEVKHWHGGTAGSAMTHIAIAAAQVNVLSARRSDCPGMIDIASLAFYLQVQAAD